MHPFVVGEIARESLADRPAILELLQDLPTSVVAESEEVLGFIERHGLHGKGIGYVDVHLLASVTLTDGAKLWTRDKRLRPPPTNSASHTETPVFIEPMSAFGHGLDHRPLPFGAYPRGRQRRRPRGAAHLDAERVGQHVALLHQRVARRASAQAAGAEKDPLQALLAKILRV